MRKWQRIRTERPLSPPKIHQKNISTLSKFYKTTSECWQRTSGTQKADHCLQKQIFNLCFLVFVVNFVHLKPSLQYPILPESEITGLTTLSSFGLSFFSTRCLCLLPPPSLLYSTLWISVCSRRWRTPKELVTGRICLSPFHFPLLCSLLPLSTSSLSSSLYNSVNISERSRLWSAHKEVITG